MAVTIQIMLLIRELSRSKIKKPGGSGVVKTQLIGLGGFGFFHYPAELRPVITFRKIRLY
jgi:hypothetical protein